MAAFLLPSGGNQAFWNLTNGSWGCHLALNGVIWESFGTNTVTARDQIVWDANPYNLVNNFMLYAVIADPSANVTTMYVNSASTPVGSKPFHPGCFQRDARCAGPWGGRMLEFHLYDALLTNDMLRTVFTNLKRRHRLQSVSVT